MPKTYDISKQATRFDVKFNKCCMQHGGHTMQVKLLNSHKQQQTQRYILYKFSSGKWSSVVKNFSTCLQQIYAHKHIHIYVCKLY